MPEPDTAPLLPLLYTALGLLVLLVLISWGIHRRLARLERRIAEVSTRDGADATPPSGAETSAGGAFETFLGEDPARRAMPKAEQFAAYRKWRQENGLNWSGS